MPSGDSPRNEYQNMKQKQLPGPAEPLEYAAVYSLSDTYKSYTYNPRQGT